MLRQGEGTGRPLSQLPPARYNPRMIYRIDVRTTASLDPQGQAVRQQISEIHSDVGPVSVARVFLIDADATAEQMKRVANELLADPVVDTAQFNPATAGSRIELHLKPGVMDPVAASTEMAVRDMGIAVREVRTGKAYLFERKLDRRTLEQIATRALANGVIEDVHFEPWRPRGFPRAIEAPFRLRHVPIRQLSDEALLKLSREGHLFLSLAEMKAIQSYYREQSREPTDAELETLAQTWSEHCVHKTLKSAVDVVDEQGNVLRRYSNLIKETIFASTVELMKSRAGFCLSVFRDNAGVIAFDEADAVCVKVETHNHPSAIEPYGGASTGVGGVIRDVLGTGLSAKPVANTDVFCVAFPDYPSEKLPRGLIHPKRSLQQIVAGVRDYGNRMGIPTVNGAVHFDDRYVGNPLVFCGCVGLIPRDKIEKEAKSADAIVLIGGRTGRDGIHGATFSSAELTDTHADEFSHAVQIGNAITEKKMADVILQARDRGLFDAITDCGAGGLSSAVGEMGSKIGAFVELDRVPLKYAGLRYDEVWISEAQERMVLSVPSEHVDELLKLARSEDVEATVIGHFGTEKGELILNYRGTEVARLSMRFLHRGLPMPRRRAVRPARGVGAAPTHAERGRDAHATVMEQLLAGLRHPNVASKHWIIRQYDHEVQGGSVVKPLTGPLQIGPSDAAVIRPKLNSWKGVAIACGLAPHIEDPYDMAIASIDEAVRNAVAVGAHPDQIAILDNFCWPSVEDAVTMGTLVRASEACRDAAQAYGIPFISGKDSLNNQFTNNQTGEVIRIPRTLLISAIGIIDDIRKCVTMDLKKPGNQLYWIGPRSGADLTEIARVHRGVAQLIQQGLIRSCHDCSEGGLVVAAAEMCIASGLGMECELWRPFEEPLATYVVEVENREQFQDVVVDNMESLPSGGMFGTVTREPAFRFGKDLSISIDELSRAWRGTLDW